MLRQLFIFGVVLVIFIAETSCQHIILPTYRPPRTRKPIIRTVREAGNDEPLWLYKGDDVERAPATGDHPYLPPYIDDVKMNPNERYARSLDSPSAKRGGGSHTTSSSSRNTGPTHPGHNRRNARSIRLPGPGPRFPSPTFPKPFPIDPLFPRPSIPKRPLPIYARVARDIQFPGIKKPSHRDIIIPNWNPHVRTQPWQKIGGKRRF